MVVYAEVQSFHLLDATFRWSFHNRMLSPGTLLGLRRWTRSQLLISCFCILFSRPRDTRKHIVFSHTTGLHLFSVLWWVTFSFTDLTQSRSEDFLAVTISTLFWLNSRDSRGDLNCWCKIFSRDNIASKLDHRLSTDSRSSIKSLYSWRASNFSSLCSRLLEMIIQIWFIICQLIVYYNWSFVS